MCVCVCACVRVCMSVPRYVCMSVGLSVCLALSLALSLALLLALKWGRIRGEDINFIKAHANQKGAAKAGSKKRKAAAAEK